MKDLFKPGRKINEYINEDGTPKIGCISCGRRPNKSSVEIGGWLCGDNERFAKCNPDNTYENDWKFSYLLWKPRVDYNTLITDKDCKL